MNYEIAYNKAIEMIDRDIKLLFQRLNFFLIAMGFLLAAFATIFVVDESPELITVKYIIVVVGFLLSLLFATINYLNTWIIWRIGQYIRELENQDFKELVEEGNQPYQRVNQIVLDSMNRNHIFALTWEMIRSVWDVIFNPRKKAREGVADHTYIVPLLFAFIWVIIFIALLCC